jgi:hypothetical protein
MIDVLDGFTVGLFEDVQNSRDFITRYNAAGG